MKIEQLTIENFKCFKSEKTFDFGRITVLTGANSSGKSSVMYALLSALQTENFPFQLSTNGLYVNLGDFKEVAYKHNENSTFQLGLTLKSKFSTKNKFKIKWMSDKIDLLPSVSSIFIETFNSRHSIYEGHGFTNLSIEIFSTSFREVKDIEKWCSHFENILQIYFKQNNCKVLSPNPNTIIFINFDFINFRESYYVDFLHGHNLLIENPLSPILLEVMLEKFDSDINSFNQENVNYLSAFRQSPQRTYLEKNKASYKIGTEGEGCLDQIVEWEKRSNGKIKELVKVMKDLNLIENIKTKRLSGGRFEVLVKPTNSEMLTSLANVGFGISQFLPVIVADLQLPNDSTLFLAEPEIHLHPSVQSKFGDYVINQINITEKNYIIETHSEYFLNKLRLAIVKGELKKEDVKVYFLENNGDDTDVYDVDFKKNGAIKNAPKSFFDTYSIDVMDIALNAFAE
jgi:predicted ATPase